jgi:hypothetical protein
MKKLIDLVVISAFLDACSVVGIGEREVCNSRNSTQCRIRVYMVYKG